MRSGDSFKVGTLRMISAAFHNKEIEKKGKGLEPGLSEEEVIEIIFKEAKKRKEAIDAYTKGNRSDLSEKELKELELIQKYLPEQMGENEIEKAVSEILKKTDVASEKNFGKIMGEVMKELKGKADAKLVGEVVKKKLSSG